jgi:hypothetical protein
MVRIGKKDLGKAHEPLEHSELAQTEAPRVRTEHSSGLGLGKLFRSIGGHSSLAKTGVLDQFPLEDLKRIPTEGQHARGFRLDGDQVKGQRVAFRRTKNEAGSPQVTLELRLDPRAVGTFLERFERFGATPGEVEFRDSKTGRSWSPKNSDAVVIEEPGQYRVTLCPSQPAALRGLLRIEVLGDDAKASKQLQNVVRRFGMASLFAPSDKTSAEKNLLFQIAWSMNKDAYRSISSRPIGEVGDEEIAAGLRQTGRGEPPPEVIAAIPRALANDASAELFRTAKYLLARDPRLLLQRVELDPSILRSFFDADQDEGWRLGTDLLGRGFSTRGLAEVNAAEAEAIVRILWMATADPAIAARLLESGSEGRAIGEARSAIENAGLAGEARRMITSEVYPGYFTSVDPTRSEKMREAGAAYLYRSLARPSHVVDELKNGSTSQLERFSAGCLTPGAATQIDFESGGAEAVFTRLVTKSALADPDEAFYDSAGAMRYHLLIDLEATNRNDWWAHRTDNYGAAFGLEDENHGVAFARVLESNYDPLNEVMFPVGIDPGLIRGVTCASEGDRDRLLEELRAAGIERISGRPIEDAVIVTHGALVS